MTAVETSPALSTDERKGVLTSFLARQTHKGWRLQFRADYEAQLIKGKPTNHVLHLILSIITFGFWIPVWIGVAIFSGQSEWFVTVDEFGNVR
jgi:hypothetical protein